MRRYFLFVALVALILFIVCVVRFHSAHAADPTAPDSGKKVEQETVRQTGKVLWRVGVVTEGTNQEGSPTCYVALKQAKGEQVAKAEFPCDHKVAYWDFLQEMGSTFYGSANPAEVGKELNADFRNFVQRHNSWTIAGFTCRMKNRFGHCTVQLHKAGNPKQAWAELLVFTTTQLDRLMKNFGVAKTVHIVSCRFQAGSTPTSAFQTLEAISNGVWICDQSTCRPAPGKE